ncbi:superoxide dismutase family protein [Pilimelia columellifera]|uniref:Superoxide dismutase copper/zinc binding domain-containing protein n=1 Tax=Pilimelia columellifera subsp. columellifera TaxID=706583 RepID=A0ABP6AB16_9ACTN
MRRATAALLLLAAPLAAAGCGDDDAPQPTGSATPPPSASATAGAPIVASGALAAYTAGAAAITYDPKLAPLNATLSVAITPAGDESTVELTAGGFVANRAYGAHIHSAPCGATGDAAGPHFQQSPDPAASASPPSVDPSYANSTNEIWLDFRTDATGGATVTTKHRGTFTNTPRSVIVHASTTSTEPGKAGTAGARLACLNVPARG